MFISMRAAISHCLKTILFTLISLFFSLSTFAKNPPPVSREALFQRAYKSLGFFLYIAQNDQSFMNALSTEEKNMLRGIYGVAIGTATFNWLIENKVQRFGQPGKYFYRYAITKDRLVELPTPFEKPIGLQFSSDQNLFNLDPAQPIRTGVTETGMDKDIFVNLAIINRSDLTYDLAAATSLMVHEFGHKLADQKIQSAVDSLAAKLENYLRAQINTTEINGKKVNLLRFKYMPKYDQLVEDMLYGRYMGVNIPAQVHYLSAFDQQGVYVWIEDQGKVSDISDVVTAQIRKNPIVQFVDQPSYNFVRHNITLAARISVAAAGAENIKISINSNLLQFVVPFLTTGSAHPAQIGLFDRAFTNMDPQSGDFFSYEFTIDVDDYRIKKIRSLSQTFEYPQFEVNFVTKKIKGSDLELYFNVKADRGLRLDPRVAMAELWPELKIRIGHSDIFVKATSFSPETDEFKFIFRDIDKISPSKVTVIGMQMRVKDPILVLKSADIVAQLFLPNEIVVAEGNPGAVAKSPPSMKSVQIWDGKTWAPLRKNSAITEGQLLRFVFDITEPLRELSIDQSFIVRNETTTSFGGNLIPGMGVVLEPHQRSIRFESQDLRQNVRDGKLYVDINVDHQLATQLKMGAPVMFDQSGVPGGNQMAGFGFVENNDLSTGKERILSGISFVTQSGLSNDLTLKYPIPFIKPPGGSPPDDSSAIYERLKCVSLFIN